MDAKYAPADLTAEVQKCNDLNKQEKRSLLRLIQKYESLFDGSLGTWNSKPIDIELKPDVKPYHTKPYPVPYSQEAKLKMECERLVE